jgi:hypothetical protein
MQLGDIDSRLNVDFIVGLDFRNEQVYGLAIVDLAQIERQRRRVCDPLQLFLQLPASRYFSPI